MFKHFGNSLMSSPGTDRESFSPEALFAQVEIQGIVSYPGKNSAKALREFNRPRPALTRFPFSMEFYEEHKRVLRSQDLEIFQNIKSIKDERQPHIYSVEQPIKLMTASAGPVSDEVEEIDLDFTDAPAASPTILVDFEAIRDTGTFPPDCTIATGPHHLMTAVNSSLEIYDKTGYRKHSETLTSWFHDVIDEAKIFDPRLIYDQQEGRWVLLAVALLQDETSTESYFLLSVSRSSNPLGNWYVYSLDATVDATVPTNNWADYPGLGVDNQALYLTANMYKFGGNFEYSKIRVLSKAEVYSGVLLNFIDVVQLLDSDGQTSFGLQPCHTYGAPQVEYFINSHSPSSTTSVVDKLSVWSLADPFGTPVLKRRTVKTDQFDLPPYANQQGSPDEIDTCDVRVMNAVFQGGSIWCALSTRQNWEEGGPDTSAIHWFQINPTSGRVVQESHYGHPDRHYYYPAIMPDINGNVIMVFCRSSASEFPSIYYTGRRSTDPLGYMGPSQLLQAGISSYVKRDSRGMNRWGDYSGISIDPLDWRTIWFYSEYAGPINRWRTWVGSSKF